MLREIKQFIQLSLRNSSCYSSLQRILLAVRRQPEALPFRKFVRLDTEHKLIDFSTRFRMLERDLRLSSVFDRSNNSSRNYSLIVTNFQTTVLYFFHFPQKDQKSNALIRLSSLEKRNCCLQSFSEIFLSNYFLARLL